MLELDLPVLNFRQPAYDQILSVHILGHLPYQIDAWYREGMEIFKTVTSNKLSEFPKDLTSLFSKDARSDSDFMVNVGYSYARLMLMGYSDLASRLLFSMKNPMLIAQILFICEKVLTANHHSSLGGVISWYSIEALAAKNVGIDSARASIFDTFPGIISTIVGLIGSQTIAEPLLEFVLKLGKPIHVISIFDLSKINSNKPIL